MSQQRSLSQTNLASNFQYSSHSLKGRSPSVKSQSSVPASQPDWEFQTITHNGSTSWKRGQSYKERNPQPPSVSRRPVLSQRSKSVSHMEISPVGSIQQHQSYTSMERPVVNATASVMIYDDANRKWVQAGNSNGLSKVQIYHHSQNNSFRVVGRLKTDQSVVINSAILKGLKYNQATATFHQWRDSRQVYGLNFQTEEDAQSFAKAMMSALETLSAPSRPPVPTTVPPQPPSQAPPQQNGPSVQEDVRPRPAETQNQRSFSSSSEPPASSASRISPEAPVVPSSAPPAPPAQPPVAPAAPPAPPAPPGPPPPPSGGGPPPPPPPPPPVTQPGAGAPGGGGLAGALAAAKLKKVAKDDAGAGDAGSAPKGRGGGGGMVDMMSEMQMKLKRRKEVVQNSDEGKSGSTSPLNQNKEAVRKPWEKNPVPVANRPKANGISSVDGGNSPLITRRRGSFQNGNNASDSDLEKMKQEILTEMRKEMNKMKAEIIDAIKQELGKS